MSQYPGGGYPNGQYPPNNGHYPPQNGHYPNQQMPPQYGNQQHPPQYGYNQYSNQQHPPQHHNQYNSQQYNTQQQLQPPITTGPPNFPTQSNQNVYYSPISPHQGTTPIMGPYQPSTHNPNTHHMQSPPTYNVPYSSNQSPQENLHTQQTKEDENGLKLAERSAFTQEELEEEAQKESATQKIENKLEDVVGEGTVETTKKITHTIRKIVLTSVFISTPILAIVSLILAIIAWAQFWTNFALLGQVIENWKLQPISEVAFTRTICPSGFQNINITIDQNIIRNRRPYCWDKQTNMTSVFNANSSILHEGFCGKNQTRPYYSNYFVPSLLLNRWRDYIVCVKHGGTPAIDRKALKDDNTCPAGTKLCAGKHPTCQAGAKCPIVDGRAFPGKFSSFDAQTEQPFHFSTSNYSVILQTEGLKHPLVDLLIAPKGTFCSDGSLKSVRNLDPLLDVRYQNDGTCNLESERHFVIDSASEFHLLQLANQTKYYTASDSHVAEFALWGVSEIPWNCKDISRAAVAASHVNIQIVFYSQMVLFILTFLSSILTGVLIPLLLIYNGHLRSLWCGKNEVAEKDHDDLKRYNLLSLALKFLIQTLRFVPIIAVMVIAYRAGGFFGDLAKGGCSTNGSMNEAFRFFASRINSSTSFLNIALLIVSILSYLGTWGALFFVIKMVITNLRAGRSAFSRPDSKTGTSVFSWSRIFGK